MKILGICLLVFFVGFALNKASRGWDELDFWGGLVMMLSGACLFIGLIAKPLNNMEVRAAIREFEATRLTLEVARKNSIGMESAAIQIKVIESNEWLANQKYYKSTIWGWWIPEDINALEPIE